MTFAQIRLLFFKYRNISNIYFNYWLTITVIVVLIDIVQVLKKLQKINKTETYLDLKKWNRNSLLFKFQYLKLCGGTKVHYSNVQIISTNTDFLENCSNCQAFSSRIQACCQSLEVYSVYILQYDVNLSVFCGEAAHWGTTANSQYWLADIKCIL